VYTELTFFSVGNGDMSLISLGDHARTKILIDCNIAEGSRAKEQLLDRLQRDERSRPYVDAFLISHPDEDHCRGLAKHFYLGPPEDYPDDAKPRTEKRILIRELWSSPMVFRRASQNHVLCADARALNAEARRRVRENQLHNFAADAGNRILILGDDKNGKTLGLQPIVVPTGSVFNRINRSSSLCFSARLLAPKPESDGEEEYQLSKNHSSVVLLVSLARTSGAALSCRFLTGGDAEVAIWDKIWEAYGADPDALAYDLLLSPHHCSWHSLSYDSWSALRDRAKLSSKAFAALSQIRANGIIVASSAAIIDDDNDPPCFGAKRVYSSIAARASGQFRCTGDTPSKPLELAVTHSGLEISDKVVTLTSAVSGLHAPIKPWGCR
jgi:hypothetical protein